MNYYLNVPLIGSSTKNDRCQDVTLAKKDIPNQNRCKGPSEPLVVWFFFNFSEEEWIEVTLRGHSFDRDLITRPQQL